MGCGGSILTQILRSPNSVAQYDTQGDADKLFLPGSSEIYLVNVSDGAFTFHMHVPCDMTFLLLPSYFTVTLTLKFGLF
jgi:hypothetical protein